MGTLDLLWGSYIAVFWAFVHSAHFGCFVHTQCYLPLGHTQLPPSLLAFIRALFASFPVDFNLFLRLADLLLVLQSLFLLYFILHFFKRFGKSIALILFLTWLILFIVYLLNVYGVEELKLQVKKYLEDYRLFLKSTYTRAKHWAQEHL